MIGGLSYDRAAAVRPAKFAAVGVANTVLDFAVFSALVYAAGMQPTMANLISYSCGIANSFIFNKHWTFAETRKQGLVQRQFALFAASNLVGLGIASAIVWALADPIGPIGAKVAAIGATFVWNYLTSRHLVFRDRQDSGRQPS